MNLDELKARTVKVTKVTLDDGSEWHLRKLSATVAIAVGNAFLAAGHTDPNGSAPSQEQSLDAHSLLLSKAVCNEAGELLLDSDEGRMTLKELDYPTIQELANKAQEWSVPGSAKKNSPEKSDSPSFSAVSSAADTDTPTKCLTT